MIAITVVIEIMNTDQINFHRFFANTQRFDDAILVMTACISGEIKISIPISTTQQHSPKRWVGLGTAIGIGSGFQKDFDMNRIKRRAKKQETKHKKLKPRE